ncbi:MAG TPA: hypothetical protein PKE69_22915 [Pyrinomonadaceae bacterium]|nr:hypothetical protein [Pyrinomonadaceae bacterium]
MNPNTKLNRPYKDGETKETGINFGNLELDEVLEDLLQIKPTKNGELKKDAPKKKSKPKTKK